MEGVGESMGDVSANCEGESSCPLDAVFMTTSHRLHAISGSEKYSNLGR